MPKEAKEPESNIEIIQTSPQQAINWLDAVPDYQRKIDERQINKLIMAIQRNEWRINGATIVFNAKGELIDGQHRLQAIAKAGKTVPCIVVTGVSNDEMTFASLGDVKVRKAADFIHTNNANVVAAVLRLLWFTENNLLFHGLKAKNSEYKNMPTSPPIPEIVRLAKKHAEEIAITIPPLKDAMRLTTCGAWIPFLMYYFTINRPRVEATKVAEFMSRVIDGVNLGPNSPVLKLRQRLQQQSAHGSLAVLPRRVKEALVLKALNFFLEGKEVDRLTWAPEKEPFPLLRGYDKEEPTKMAPSKN